MYPGVLTPPVTDYQAGDINGLQSQHYIDTP